MTHLLCLSDDDVLVDQIRRVLGAADSLDDLDVVARSPGDLSGTTVTDAKDLTDDDPLIIVFDASSDAERAIEIAGEVDRIRSDVGMILVAHPLLNVISQAQRVGVREVVPPSPPDNELTEALVRTYEIAERRRTERLPIDRGAERARTICVLSPKGGAGKTMLSTNLAVGIAAEAPRKTVLVDLDLQFGDVANALRLVPEQDIADAVASGIVDATALKLNLTSHPTGLFALCAPDDPGDADDIRAEHVTRALSLLAHEFSYVVIDTDPGLGEHTLAAIELATDLVFVCATDVASVRGLRKELAALDRIGMTHQRRHFVLNRADARVGLSADDIASTIAMPIDVFVPSSRSVPLSMNQGTALLEDQIESPATNSLRQLVAKFVDVSAPTENHSRGFLRRR